MDQQVELKEKGKRKKEGWRIVRGVTQLPL